MKELTRWDFPDRREVYDYEGRTTVPDFTPRNFIMLATHVIELTAEVKELREIVTAIGRASS